MKKLLTEKPTKDLVRRRQRAEERKRHNLRQKREDRGRRKHSPPVQYNWPSQRQKNNDHIVSPPSRFSLVGQPDETIEFLGKIRQLSEQGKNVVLNMSDVTELTHDAIVALISLMEDEGLRVLGGNSPENAELEELWRRSGFFNYVRSKSPPVDAVHGDIRHRISKKVEGKTAKDLIQFATEKLYGSPCKDKTVYRTLLECMNNTRSHASGSETPRKWWATVYCKPGSGTACFTFIDNGVGIFGSVSRNMQMAKKLARALGITDNALILRDILHGKIPSSTGLPYRGKGLPMFYKDCQRGHLQNFTIIANDAYGNISRSEYRKLDKPFRGTCIYWEISGDHNVHGQ